jgi:hypothetical protein
MFVATFGGVVVAFELERYRENTARRVRLVGALRMIRDQVERNVGLCKQIKDELSQHGTNFVQYYNLKTDVWQAVLPSLVDLRSPELGKQIATEYYEYDHMRRKIDARFEVFKQATAMPESFGVLSNAVLTGANSLQISGNNLLKAIDRRLSELE